uniref:Uncharacterized protein n=1 Tax=Romanomermis culicivorax TaxID=13658 RepID=A0A915IN07_ROMCU
MIPIDPALWVNLAQVGPTVYDIERDIKPKLLQSDMSSKPVLAFIVELEDCNLDMLKRDFLDIKQEPDEAATKFLKRVRAH